MSQLISLLCYPHCFPLATLTEPPVISMLLSIMPYFTSLSDIGLHCLCLLEILIFCLFSPVPSLQEVQKNIFLTSHSSKFSLISPSEEAIFPQSLRFLFPSPWLLNFEAPQSLNPRSLPFFLHILPRPVASVFNFSCFGYDLFSGDSQICSQPGCSSELLTFLSNCLVLQSPQTQYVQFWADALYPSILIQ